MLKPGLILLCNHGIVNEKLLSDYLHHVFPPSKEGPTVASLRKPLGFQDLGSHLERLLSEGETSEDSRDPSAEGRLGPQPVVLDHTSGFEGLLFVDDDLLGVIGHSNFSSIRATTCIYKGKWAYEVLISSQGLMQIGWCTLSCRFNQEEGVGDTPDSYAYDGNRVRKWNVTTTNYGKVKQGSCGSVCGRSGVGQMFMLWVFLSSRGQLETL
ncbi:hypothetical protein AMECASPLE_018922 [Ameca splendens]|uniref:SPRY domain-containing protein n=1 Tax=Ameca splendens TaxID=208324 RepID=A0ABV1A992_9TELE